MHHNVSCVQYVFAVQKVKKAKMLNIWHFGIGKYKQVKTCQMDILTVILACLEHTSIYSSMCIYGLSFEVYTLPTNCDQRESCRNTLLYQLTRLAFENITSQVLLDRLLTKQIFWGSFLLLSLYPARIMMRIHQH